MKTPEKIQQMIKRISNLENSLFGKDMASAPTEQFQSLYDELRALRINLKQQLNRFETKNPFLTDI
jgi:uncharacterized coiled-coil DUF342 family protein